jgi:hypothetical protein
MRGVMSDPPPDRIERAVRVGCGGLFGLATGLAIAIYVALSTASEMVLIVAVFAAVCALLALRFGDRFWYGLRHLKWLSPWF